MSKLPVVTPGQAVKVLKKAGFVFKRQAGSHARFVHMFDPNRYATVSMHPGDLSRENLASILRQAKMTVQEFISLL